MDWIKEWQEFDSDHYDFRHPNITYKHPIYQSLHAIDEIVKNYPSPYTLMVSGGIDSQAMIYAWLLSKVKFKAVSIKYVSDGIWFNDYDLKNLELYRDKFNFDLEYSEFDIFNFYETNYYDIAEEYKCSSPQICSHIHNISLIKEGTVIQSGNLLNINHVPLNNPILALYRYAKTTKKLIPYFFLSTASLAYSSFTNEKKNKITDQYLLKTSLYKKAGFEIIPARRSFSGFEKIKKHYHTLFAKNLTMGHRLKTYPNFSRETFDIILRFPLIEKYDKRNPIFHTNVF